ncbi:MAG: flagellar basal body rod protein FlgB [Acidobacteria bacterium]|nr:flagellar basal body rod protein FlgB [Acidobacteriota bacterium]
MIEDRMFPVLEDLLSWTSKRQQALSANIANMDTPGYRARDYSFSQELNSLGITATSGNHIVPVADQASANVYEVGTPEKPNGNTVNLERELTEITKNGLQYITLVQYLNQKLRTLRAAINDGGKI